VKKIPNQRVQTIALRAQHDADRSIAHYEFSEDNIPSAAETAFGFGATAVCERGPSWLRACEPGAAPRQLPAVRGLLSVGLSVPFLP